MVCVVCGMYMRCVRCVCGVCRRSAAPVQLADVTPGEQQCTMDDFLLQRVQILIGLVLLATHPLPGQACALRVCPSSQLSGQKQPFPGWKHALIFSSLVVFSAVGPGASMEDWPEEAGDGVQASDRRHH